MHPGETPRRIPFIRRVGTCGQQIILYSTGDFHKISVQNSVYTPHLVQVTGDIISIGHRQTLVRECLHILLGAMHAPLKRCVLHPIFPCLFNDPASESVDRDLPYCKRVRHMVALKLPTEDRVILRGTLVGSSSVF